jgi:4-amino-4-deoxy-L-arabinose transferase-like glycosyltransferase
VARVAAVAWAMYPFSIYFSSDRVWDYALTAFLLSLSFWVAQTLPRRTAAAWAGFGLLCGVAALSNPSVLSVLAPTGLLALYRARETGKPWLKHGACAALMLIAVCSPWVARNQLRFHRPTFIRDGFWLEFWAGNNGDTFKSNPDWAHPASNDTEMRRYQAVSEPEYMAEKRALALTFVQRHPGQFVLTSLRRAFCFWTGLWSLDRKYIAQDPTEIPDFFYCGAVSLLAFRGAWRWWRADRQAALPYIAALVFFPVTYYVTHSSPDYRQPLEPIVIVLAVIGVMGPLTGEDERPRESSEADDEVNDERFAIAS